MKSKRNNVRCSKHPRYTKAEMAEGKIFLRATIRAIKNEEAKGQWPGDAISIAPLSARAELMFPALNQANLKALVIFRRSGGWGADLVLKNTPGLHDVIGTPDHQLYPTRELALQHGYWLVLSVLTRSREADCSAFVA